MSSGDSQRDPLDELLASARWPDVEAERMARLQTYWASLEAPPAVRAAGRWSRVAVRCAAVAAAVIFAVGGAWWASQWKDLPETDSRETQIAEKTTDRELDDDAQARPRAEQPVVASRQTSRPATALEAAAFDVWQAEQRKAVWQQDAAVEQAIAAIRFEPQLSEEQIKAAARPLLARRAYSQQRLLESARYFDGSRQTAALRLLAHVGTNRIAGELLPLVGRERSRTAAAKTLVAVVSAETLGSLARRERNVDSQRTMLVALLTVGDQRCVGQFLTCVASDSTRDVALQLVSTVEALPTAVLVGWLQSRDAQRSAAAATALAFVRDPATVEAVVALARSRQAPAAALVALVGSQEPAAQSFVSAARRSPLVSAVNEAEYQWRVLAGHARSDL